MNRQIQDDALYNDRFEEEEKKTEWLDRKITFTEFIIQAIIYWIFWLFVVLIIKAIF